MAETPTGPMQFVKEGGVGSLVAFYAHHAVQMWADIPLPGTAEGGEWTAVTYAFTFAAGGILAGIGRAIAWLYHNHLKRKDTT